MHTKNFDCIGIILARKGSKRLPNKNTLILNGKPMIEYTIKEALKSKYINRIIVSTDDDKVKEIASKYSTLEVHDRPPELAQDDTPTEKVMDYILESLDRKPDMMVNLQPTSPLRKAKHIDRCIDVFIAGKFDSVVSVTSISPHTYYPNGSVYVFRDDMWSKNSGFVLMSPLASLQVDNISDFELIEQLIKHDVEIE